MLRMKPFLATCVEALVSLCKYSTTASYGKYLLNVFSTDCICHALPDEEGSRNHLGVPHSYCLGHTCYYT